MNAWRTMAPILCGVLLAWPCAARAGGESAGAGKDAGAEIATAAGDTVAFDALDEVPKPVKTVPPKYPDSARRRHLQGTVFLRALVTKTGRVEQVSVAPGKGVSPELDKAAITAIRQWTFSPGRKKGQAVSVYIVIPVKFKLD